MFAGSYYNEAAPAIPPLEAACFLLYGTDVEK
jgi:hypothetical protein